jgi:aryl-alcohol dehydrogenase-like predicted oxidoreductase
MTTKTPSRIDSLARYHLLGRSGLRVSPLCLGTMTFGTEWGFGVPKDTSHRILARYLEAGGNFVDTADAYTNGSSEAFIGDYFAANGGRDRAVIATKFTLNAVAGDPNAGGNGRKNIHRALEGSLRRLKTDYVDLYWLHAWDGLTPVEEVMRTLNGLVQAGKVRYIGLSDVPAWYFARAQSVAEREGWEPVSALQLEYSLVERNIEREHIPAALALGAALTPWSPLASGLLSGKYTREGAGVAGEGRLASGAGNPALAKLFTERNWRIVDALLEGAKQLDRSPAQVALAWVARRPGVASTLIGATRLEQLESNLHALDLELPAELVRRLDAVSRPELVHPYHFFEDPFFTAGTFTGGTQVRAEPAWFRPAR